MTARQNLAVGGDLDVAPAFNAVYDKGQDICKHDLGLLTHSRDLGKSLGGN
jgi:hypothetical protein